MVGVDLGHAFYGPFNLLLGPFEELQIAILLVDGVLHRGQLIVALVEQAAQLAVLDDHLVQVLLQVPQCHLRILVLEHVRRTGGQARILL